MVYSIHLLMDAEIVYIPVLYVVVLQERENWGKYGTRLCCDAVETMIFKMPKFAGQYE